MLTQEQAIAEYDYSRQTVIPDRLNRKTHSHYLPIAETLLQVYRSGIGQVRRSLHEQVRQCFQDETSCPTRRIAAFCKLLDDASEYHQDHCGAAAALRQKVFTLAAGQHPLVQSSDQLFDHDEALVKTQIAEQLGRPWPEIEAELFADVIEFHRLRSPPMALDAASLLARYNVAQTQAALYGALSMTVWARQDFKLILRYAKLARLMHVITRQGDEYVFRFSGPASVMRHTRRYGVAFAKFLCGLLSARQWKMQAMILGPAKRRLTLRLSSADGLRGEVAADDFDSELESGFACAWQQTQTHGWTLKREATVLHQDQAVFMPDFTLQHAEHGEVQLEIVGFWTPEYLREKAAKLEQFRDSARILLAVFESGEDAVANLGMPLVKYKTKLRPQDVLTLLDAFA